MTEIILFFLVIFGTNVIQGITGFAGTLLAMPVSLFLVGYGTAKPVLNFLGLLAGVFIFVRHIRSVKYKELLKVTLFMAAGMLVGFFLKDRVSGFERYLYIAFGIFILILSAAGLIRIFSPRENEKPMGAVPAAGTLLTAGVIHGIFVSGGPLAVAYLSRVLKDKEAFRSTISTLWIILNGIIFGTDIVSGAYDINLIKIQALSVPFFIAGMLVGAALFKRMKQRTFMILTYILLIASGILLLFKS